MTTHQFRQQVKQVFPHVTVKVKTVSFQDLARASKQCLTTIIDQAKRAAEQIEATASDRAVAIIKDARRVQDNIASAIHAAQREINKW